MANVFKINAAGGLVIPVLSSDPSSPENGAMWYNSTSNTFKKRENGSTSTISSGEISDSTFRIIDDGDGTKKIAFEASGITTGTTRTVTMPDANVNLVDVNNAILKDGSRAFTAAQSMGGFKISSLADPTLAQDAATKAYVDATATGLDVKQSVRLATTAALAANTAAGSGIGKTLTANANGALSVDGVAVVVSDRVLVKDEATGANNGLYVVTATGSAGAPFVLTRATDFDQNVEVTAGAFAFVAEGTNNADSGWVLSTNDAIVVDTTSLSFTQFSGTGQITAGAGLTKTGNTLDVGAGNGISVAADSVAVNADATGGANLAKAINVSSNGVAVKVDDASIEGDAGTGQLKVKDAGITNAKVATGIDAAKIADGSVSNAEFQYIGTLTSDAQTQLNGKASTTLSNLGTTAINTNLISDTDNTDDLGSQAINWKDVHAKSLKSTNGIVVDSDSDAGGDRASDLSLIQKSVKRGKQASALIEEEYVDSSALTDNTTAVVAAFTFAKASYNALEIEYLIREATSLKTRVGKLLVVTDGTVTSIVDTFTETADIGISWSAAVATTNIEISYTSTSTGNARTMRSDLKRFRAI